MPKTTPKPEPKIVAKPKPGTKGLADTVRARIDPALKANAESILSEVGLNASDAIRLFYTHVTLVGGLPFAVRVPNAETQQAMRDAKAGIGLTEWSDFEEFKKAMRGDGKKGR